jgi:glycosyltransferase involved in cell wall biosynthesis
MNDAVVSIVVLTYNNSGLPRTCSESVLAPDYPDLEVIVVDNASTVDTTQIVRDEFRDRVKLRIATAKRRAHCGR